MAQILRYFAIPLFGTLLIETCTAFLLGIRNRKDLLLVILVNILTNPVVVYLAMCMDAALGTALSRLLLYGIVEPLVVIVEWRYYKAYLENAEHPFRLSLILNICSIIGGIILWLWKC